eukprot:m.136401 g.136401  ORF g.136401 m.136401 type:complete len:58 (+) comp52473_c0_seq1:1171-1344(+)
MAQDVDKNGEVDRLEFLSCMLVQWGRETCSLLLQFSLALSLRFGSQSGLVGRFFRLL